MCDEHKSKNARKLGLILILAGAVGLAVSLFFHEMGMAIPSLMAVLLITLGSFRVLSTYNAD